MANILATADGSVLAGSTWTGGVVPTAGDTAVVNGHSLTMPGDWTCDKVSSRVISGSADGGTVTMSDGVTFTGTVEGGNSTNGVLYYTGNETIYIVGDVYGGTTASSRYGVRLSGAGTIYVTGNLYGGNTTTSSGVYHAGTTSGNVYVTGSCYGGVIGSSSGLQLVPAAGNCTISGSCVGSATTGGSGLAENSACRMLVDVFGDCIGGGSSSSVGASIYGNIIVRGDCIGGSAATTHGLSVSGATSQVHVYGDVFAGSVTGNGINCNANSTATFIEIDGNVYGSDSYSSVGIYNQYVAELLVHGNIYAGGYETSNGIYLNGNCICIAEGIIYGNSYGSVGSTATGPTAGVVNRYAANLTVTTLVCGSGGVFPVCGAFKMASENGTITVKNDDYTTLQMQSAQTLAPAWYPEVSDVRSGTSFANGALNGTCEVPTAENTALGVPVGDTVGTAMIQTDDLLNAIGAMFQSYLG